MAGRYVYRKTHPSVFGWGPIARQMPECQKGGANGYDLFCWLAGCILIYGCLFGVSKILLGSLGQGIGMLGLGLAAEAYIYWDLSKRGWASVVN